MTNKEYQAFLRWYLKDRTVPVEPPVFGRKGFTYSDYWTEYKIGNERKIVYFKRGVLFPDTDKKRAVEVTKSPQGENKERFSQSLSRTKANVFELAMCNEFQYFCTFTLDEKKRDRFDISEFRKSFTQMIRNMNRSRSDEDKIKYLLIPEPHKNGAWHMHGLLKGLTPDDLTTFKLSEHIPERIKKSIRAGKPVYNWEKYQNGFGFFTCTEIENQSACCRYVTKYVTKDLLKQKRESGGHLFFASQGLKRKETVVKNSFEHCPYSDWDYENDYVKIKIIQN